MVIFKRFNSGYIALTTVLLIGAIATAVASALLISAISFSKTSTAITNSEGAFSYAEACAEDGLRAINQNVTYTTSSNITLNFTNGTCNYSVSGAAPIKNINSTGISGNSVKRIKVTTSQTSPKIVVDFWQEVASS